MKTTFQTVRTGLIFLFALTIPLQTQAQAQAESPQLLAESPQLELYDTIIPQLQVEKGTKLSDVILLLEQNWGITINAIYQDDAGEAPVPKLDLENVCFIDLLEVIETLTDVSTNVIANSDETDPIVCFKGPKKIVDQQLVASRVGAPISAGMSATQIPTNPSMFGTANAHQPAENKEASTSSQATPGQISAFSHRTTSQFQNSKLAPVGSTPSMRVFPLSSYDAKPEEILDFVEQFLMLGSTKDVDKVAAVRFLYHQGTNSLLMRGPLSDLTEIGEALEQLGGKESKKADAYGKASLDPFAGSSPSDDSADPFGGGSDPSDSTDPFGDSGNAAQKPNDPEAAEDPFSAPENKQKSKAAEDPFG